jgi:hypothetical protein
VVTANLPILDLVVSLETRIQVSDCLLEALSWRIVHPIQLTFELHELGFTDFPPGIFIIIIVLDQLDEPVPEVPVAADCFSELNLLNRTWEDSYYVAAKFFHTIIIPGFP